MHAHTNDTACEWLACNLKHNLSQCSLHSGTHQLLAPALQRPSAMYTSLQTLLQHAIAITLLAGEHSILRQGKQLRSAQVPADSITDAGVKAAGHTNPAEKKPQHMATAAEDSPITPLQPQPSQPQRSLYTPSDSDSRSHQNPSPATVSASKLTGIAADRSDASQNGIRPSTLEVQFMKSSRGSSCELGSDSTQQQPQLRPAVAKPESHPEAFSDQLDPELSPPQSRPSSPESPSALETGNDGKDHAVTHVNGYFDKSDEDNSSSSSSRPDLSDQGSEVEGEEEAGHVANGSRNRRRVGAVGDQARSLKVNLFYRINVTRACVSFYYHIFRPVILVLLSFCLCAIHTYPADCQTLVRALGQQGCSIRVVHGVIDVNYAPQHSTCSKLCPSIECCCTCSTVFGKHCLQHEMPSCVAITSMP